MSEVVHRVAQAIHEALHSQAQNQDGMTCVHVADLQDLLRALAAATERNAELEQKIEQWECESHPWSYGEDGDPVTDPVAVRDRIDTLIKCNAEAERNAKDVERLDRLQALTGGYGIGWLLRPSTSGRGWRLHESAQDGALPTVREAIDALDLAALTGEPRT